MKTLMAALLVLGTTLFGSTSALAQSNQDFNLINRTGWEVYRLYVSSSASTRWGRDILGDGTLPNGRSRKIVFTGYGADVCRFDLKIEDKQEKAWTITGIDLCKTDDITISMSGGRMVYTAE